MAFKKRVLLIILSAALILLVSNTAFASATQELPNINLVGTPYYQSVTRLETLGVFNGICQADENFPAGQNITRAAFAQVLTNFLKLDDLVPQAVGPTRYQDVDPSSLLSGEVNLLDTLNIMRGGSDGLFHPDQDLTYAQAVRSIMSASYYGEGVNGFDDTTVIRTAQQVGLIKQGEFKMRQPVTMGDLAILLDRALFEVNLPGTKENLASVDYNVYFGTAWVTGSPLTGAPYNALVFDSAIGPVAANTYVPVLLTPGIDMDSYLGQKVLVGVAETKSGAKSEYQVIYLKILSDK